MEVDGMRLLASLAFQGFGVVDRSCHRRPGLDRWPLDPNRGDRTVAANRRNR